MVLLGAKPFSRVILGTASLESTCLLRAIGASAVKSGCSQGLHEINDSQQEVWRKTIEIFEEGQARPRRVALFPEAGRERAEIHKLYECYERLPDHKKDLFGHLTQHWKDQFNARLEVLLYDLTITYFEKQSTLSPSQLQPCCVADNRQR